MFKKDYCPIKNSECTVEPRESTTITCFIAIPFKDEMATTTKTITKVLRKYGIQYYLANEDITAGQDILCKICQNILHCDFGIVEATYTNPNVMVEFGMLLGQRKPVFILLDSGRTRTSRLPADIVGLERIQYKNQETLVEIFDKGIRDFVQRLNIEERQLQNLMELARLSASRNDLASVDTLLQTIFDKLEVGNRREDRFVGLLEEIMVESKKKEDLATSFRYGLAGVRVFLMREERKRALDFFNMLMLQLSDFATSARENANNIIRDYPEFSFVSEDVQSFHAVWLEKFREREFKNSKIVDFVYAHFWYGLHHSSKPESWMKEFVDTVDVPLLKDPLPWFNLSRYPWQGYIHHNFFLILWLNAVTKAYNENKKALDIAQEAMDQIRNSLDMVALNTLEGLDPYDWYEEYLGTAEDLGKLLKEL